MTRQKTNNCSIALHSLNSFCQLTAKDLFAVKGLLRWLTVFVMESVSPRWQRVSPPTGYKKQSCTSVLAQAPRPTRIFGILQQTDASWALTGCPNPSSIGRVRVSASDSEALTLTLTLTQRKGEGKVAGIRWRHHRLHVHVAVWSE